MKLNKMISLALSSILSMSMLVGCKNNTKVNSNEEIINKNHIETEVDIIKYKDSEVLEKVINSTFKITISYDSKSDKEIYEYHMGELLIQLYENISYSVSYQGDNVYSVEVIDGNNGEYTKFEINMETDELNIILVAKDGILYKDKEAIKKFKYIVMELKEL